VELINDRFSPVLGEIVLALLTKEDLDEELKVRYTVERIYDRFHSVSGENVQAVLAKEDRDVELKVRYS